MSDIKLIDIINYSDDFMSDFARYVVNKNDIPTAILLCERYSNLRDCICCEATKVGNIDMLKSIVIDENCVFDAAIEHGQTEVIEYLLNGGRECYRRYIKSAIKLGYIEIVRLLCDFVELDDSYLRIAVKSNNVEIAKLLIAKGCTCAEKYLYNSAERSHYEMVEILIDSGMQFEHKNIAKLIKEDHIKMVEMILDKTKKVDGNRCDTVFNIAIKKRIISIIEKLIKLGFVCHYAHIKMAINDPDILKLLVKCDIQCADVFYDAVLDNNVEAIQIMLDANKKYSPSSFNIAISNGYLELVKIFNEIKPYSTSDIFSAKKNRYTKIYEYLKDKNRDIFIKDIVGELSSYNEVFVSNI